VLEFYRRYRNEELVKHLPYRPGMTLLDYPCSTGIALDQFKGWNGTAWGVDAPGSEASCASGSRRVVAAASPGLPFASAAFDVLVCRSALQRATLHRAAPGLAAAVRPVLADLARVLRPGGRLVLWESRRLYRRFDRATFAQLFLAAGLRLVEQEPFDYLAYPATVLTGQIPLLAHSLPARGLVQVLFAVDSLLARLPVLQAQSWHLIFVAEKTYV
jgi:SAM-dependent methyltransferase